MRTFLPLALASLFLAACGGGSDGATVVSANDPAAPGGTTAGATTTAPTGSPAAPSVTPPATPPSGTVPPAAPDASNPAATLAAGYADIETECSIDTPMRWARPTTIGYNGGVLRLAVKGEAERSIVLDTSSAQGQSDGSATTFRAPTSAGIEAWITIDASGALTGAGTAGPTPATTLRCGSARAGIAVAGEDSITLNCTITDSTTPGGPTTQAAAPLTFRADFANFPWRYMATTDPDIRDDEVGRLVGGSGAVVTQDPSTDGRLRYSVAIGNRGIGEDATYYDLADGRLVSMSHGNRRIVRDCK